jgi:hypothetical protein
MKLLLNGVALAALVAIATPVWAQAPADPAQANKPSASAPAAAQQPQQQPSAASDKANAAPGRAAHAAASPRTPHRMRYAHRMPRMYHHYNVYHHYSGYRGYSGYPGYYSPWNGSGDYMARELNRQELGRIGYGGAAYGPNPHASSGY